MNDHDDDLDLVRAHCSTCRCVRDHIRPPARPHWLVCSECASYRAAPRTTTTHRPIPKYVPGAGRHAELSQPRED